MSRRPAPSHDRLSRAFYTRSSELVARELLGCTLVRTLDDGTRLAGVIVETEAYIGKRDAASHAYRGRRTPRNETMYREGGTVYVYFTYGMHWCFNVVCGSPDNPIAVLVRALEPREGLSTMARLRSVDDDIKIDTDSVQPAHSIRTLCSGPAKLCQALAIDRRLNGLDLCTDDRLLIQPRSPGEPLQIDAGPRIGVAYAGSWAKRKLRFWIRKNEHVSADRRTGSTTKARPARPPKATSRKNQTS